MALDTHPCWIDFTSLVLPRIKEIEILGIVWKTKICCDSELGVGNQNLLSKTNKIFDRLLYKVTSAIIEHTIRE